MIENKYFDEVTVDDLPGGELWWKCQKRLAMIHSAISMQWPNIPDDRITNHLKLFNPEFSEGSKKMLAIMRIHGHALATGFDSESQMEPPLESEQIDS